MLLNKKYNDILGLNRRNQEYVRPFNSPSAKAIADNKILTKKILAKEGIKTPEVYKLIRSKKQLKFLDWESLPKSFVVKPNKGTGGNGIIVFYGKKKGETAWIRPSGEVMNKRDIIEIITDALNEHDDVRSVNTYEEVGMLTHDSGLVVQTSDGDEFQITVVISR